MQAIPLTDTDRSQITQVLASTCRHGHAEIVYATPAYRVGHHEWLYVVYEGWPTSLRSSGRFTQYFWRSIKHRAWGYTPEWQRDKQWPRYNGDDGSFAGCPRSIVSIYDRHLDDIDVALGRTRPMVQAQEGLFA